MAKRITKSVAKSVSGAFTFTTIQPLVRFLASDGSVASEGKRTIRKHAKTGAYVVARKDRLLAIESCEGDVAYVRLASEPVERIGDRNPQDIAPACTLADLGVAGKAMRQGAPADAKPKAAKAAPVAAASASTDARIDDLMAQVRALTELMATKFA